MTTAPNEFPSARAALDFLERRALRRFPVLLRDLRVTATGRLRHEGHVPVPQLDDVPLIDVALEHLDDLTGVPRSCGGRIEPE